MLMVRIVNSTEMKLRLEEVTGEIQQPLSLIDLVQLSLLNVQSVVN